MDEKKEKIKKELLGHLQEKLVEKEKELSDTTESYKVFKTKIEEEIEKLKLQVDIFSQ